MSVKRTSDIPRFAFGIEHEVAFINREGRFADYSNTSFAEFDAIVAQLPYYETDYPQLRIGDAGIKRKRWYIEGFERYSLQGKVVACPPKGIEIRTTIHATIQGAVDELAESFRLLRQTAASAGFQPAFTSFHPYQAEFTPDPPLNEYEKQRRQQSPEKRTSYIPMLTYGPDLNLSCPDLTPAALIDIGRKLTHYSPYIVPFSFSSPFYQGRLWEGLSVRTFIRTGIRPAALVFQGDAGDLITSNPSLTKIARLAAEAGRIEFKACDSCVDFTLYAALLALLKGLIVDGTLSERATVPDADLHQSSARYGFAHPDIRSGAQAVLKAAIYALVQQKDDDVRFLEPLQRMIQQQITPAHMLIKAFQETQSIEAALCISSDEQRWEECKQ